MPKIVYAPILEQAGFLKRKAADVVEQWVAQLDGATQGWQLTSDITIPAGAPFKIKIQAELDRESTRHIFSNYKTDDFRLLSLSQLNAAQLFVGVNSGFYTNLIPSETISTVELVGDGSSYSIVIDGVVADSSLQVGDITFNSIGGKWGAGTSAGLGIGVHSDLSVEINGVLTNQIPLTNKAQGATQLATVGNINAFMPNYTEAVWRKP